MKTFLKLLIPITLFFLTLFVVGTNLGKPFWGVHDWNGARYGNIAKNYLRYGLVGTKFGQVENGGIVSPKDFIYYTHYQPLLPILISESYKAFGVSEFATRAVPLVATAGFVVILYFIGLELVSWQTGLFASLLALATPMVRYYGKNPVHEPLALFFASLGFYGALLIKKGNKNGWKLLIVGFVLTALTNWSFVFLLIALSIFLYDGISKKNIFALWILGATLVGLHFLHIRILTGSFFGGGLGEAFLERTSIENTVVNFSILEYISRIRLWSSTLFTNTLLLPSLIGLVFLLRSKLNIYKKFTFSIAVYCIYPIFFANASFIHSYFIYYLVLPIALLGGYFCSRLIEYRKGLLIITLAILFGVWFERGSYLKALNESSGDKLAVDISTAIKDKIQANETILVEPYDYVYSRLPFLSYYSDRNILVTGVPDWTLNVEGEIYAITKNEIK